MKQLLKMTSGLLLLTILGVLGTMAYALEFDVPLTLSYIQGFFLSGFLPFLDLTTIDLTYILRLSATILFIVVSLIVTFKAISKGFVGAASGAFLGQFVMAAFLLTSSSEFYPSYPTLTPTVNFLQPFFDFLSGEPLATSLLSIYASLTAFIVIFVFLHIILLISFVRTPYSNLKSSPLAVGREKIIAEELSRFVVPSFQTAPSSRPSLPSTPMMQPQTVVSLPIKDVVLPVVTPVNPTLVSQTIQDPKLDQAKLQVSQLKERIRLIIRNELSKHALVQPQVTQEEQKVDTPQPLKPATEVKIDPIPVPSSSNDIQGKIKDIIDSHFSSLEPKTKDMVAYLINEELIKYDALNREVLETFIQEKIQMSTSDAIEALRQEFTSLYEEKVKSLTLPLQPSPSLTQVASEDTALSPAVLDHQVEAIVEKYLVTHPLVQAINVPQQEAHNPVDVSGMKEEILSTLRTELTTLQTSLATKEGELTKPEVIPVLAPTFDVATIKEELLNQLRKELTDKPITTTSSIDVDSIKAQVIDSLPVSLELESIKEDFLTLIRAELSGIKLATGAAGENETATAQVTPTLTNNDLNDLKEDVLTQLRSELTTSQHTQLQPIVQSIQSSDLLALKTELIQVIEEKVKVTQASTTGTPPFNQSSSSYDKQEIETIISQYLLAHPVYASSVEAVIPPKLKVKEAKAPSNNLRSEQFRTVVIPAEGVTRTGKKKIIRIPFYTRMAEAHPSLSAQYDELKNYILAYKVKSRLSNTGDTFRLHKEEFAKITIAGKALKLYIALDPKNYQDSTIPIDDVSDKKMYRDMPAMIKIKSNLSVKRAKQLIDDLMKQKDLQQKAIGTIQWSLQFKHI